LAYEPGEYTDGGTANFTLNRSDKGHEGIVTLGDNRDNPAMRKSANPYYLWLHKTYPVPGELQITQRSVVREVHDSKVPSEND
jgi:hypothetical protein